MPLAWSFVCSSVSSSLDLLLTVASVINRSKTQQQQINPNHHHHHHNQQPEIKASNLVFEILTKLVIYLTINLVCLYTKYLMDLAQRNAFLETRRSIETRAKIERENDKQERLLLSLLPRFVALEIIADIAKEDNHDKLLKNQFHKIYIHAYSNVR